MAGLRLNHQPLREGAVAPILRPGLGDVAGSWNLFTTPNPLFRTFALPNIGLVPFVREDHDPPCPPTLNSWFVAAVFGRMRAHVRGLLDDPTAITVAVGEYFSTQLPARWAVPQDVGRNTLVNVVRVSQGWEQIQDVGTYVNWYNITNEQYLAIPADTAFNGTNITRRTLPEHWPYTVEEGRELSAQQILQMLYLLADYTRENKTVVLIQHLVSCVLATVKQGATTRRFLDKIQNGIQAELGYEIHLEEDVIRSIYQRLLVEVDDNNISYILDRWLGFLPDEALRLRLTLTQAAGTGLTSLNVIGKALLLHPRFCWNKVAGVFLTDWNAFLVAAGEVGGNPWYGYRKNLGNVASTKYKTLSWICKELLIRVNGMMTLQQYKGWARRIPNQELVEEWFHRYQETMMGDPGDNDFDDHTQFIQGLAQGAINPRNEVYM